MTMAMEFSVFFRDRHSGGYQGIYDDSGKIVRSKRTVEETG